MGVTAIRLIRLPTVAGDKSFSVIASFFGYLPPVTVTSSPTLRIMPMGWSLPSPVTMPTSRPLDRYSYSVSRTKRSSQSGPRSSMALDTGRKALSLYSTVSISFRPAVASLTISSVSLPQTALSTPLVSTKIFTAPPLGIKLILLSSGWLARMSSKTELMTVSGSATSRLATACLGLSPRAAAANFW